MGTFPSAAFEIRRLQAATPDPVTTYMQFRAQQQQLQAGQLEVQQKQQQLSDQQASTAAMRAWDGQSLEDLPGLILKHGGSAQAVMSAKSGILDYQTKLATKKKTELENEQVQNDYIAQHIDNVKNLPVEQQPTAFEAAKTDLVQKGYLDPKMAQSLIYQGPDQLDFLEKSYMAHSSATGDALKAADTRQKNADAGLAEIKLNLSKNSKPGDFDTQIDQIAPRQLPNGQPGPNAALNMRTKAMVNFALGRGDVEGATKAIDAASAQIGAIEKETNPQVQANKIATATAEGQARANIEARMARGSNAALANVPPHLIPPATADATKAGTEYAQAQSVTQRLNAMMDSARRGNVVAYQVMPEEGTLQITTSQGVHRINQAEIEQYAGGGSLWQRMMGHVGKTLSGASIPKSVLDDMAEVQKIQAEGSRSKYENSLKTINQNYGSNFQPVPMGQGQPGVNTSSGPPAGATMKVPGSDGKMHWSDGKRDLGVVAQ